MKPLKRYSDHVNDWDNSGKPYSEFDEDPDGGWYDVEDVDSVIAALRAERDELRERCEAFEAEEQNLVWLIGSLRERLELLLAAESAALEELAEVKGLCETELREADERLAKGKGTWPNSDYVKDDTWNHIRGQAYALRRVLARRVRAMNGRGSDDLQ